MYASIDLQSTPSYLPQAIACAVGGHRVTSRRSELHDEMDGLGANERAILERIRWGSARHLAVRQSA